MAKKIYCLALLVLAFGLQAADITPGYTFQNGEQNVTATKLNSSASGTINATFYTGKTANTTPASSVVVLVYNPSTLTYQQTTLSQLVINNVDLIGNRTGAASVSGTNTVLIWDGVAYYKAQVNMLVRGNDQMITNQVYSTNYVLVTSGTNVYRVSLANLGTGFDLSSLSNKTSVAQSDLLLIYDAASASNKNITVSNVTASVPSAGEYKWSSWAFGANNYIDATARAAEFLNTNGTRLVLSGTISNRISLTLFDSGSAAIFSNRWAYAYVISDGTNTYGIYSTNATGPAVGAPTNYYSLVTPVLLQATNQVRPFSHYGDIVTLGTQQYMVTNTTGSQGAFSSVASITNYIPPEAFEAWGTMGTISNTVFGISVANDLSGRGEVSAMMGNANNVLLGIGGTVMRVASPYRLMLRGAAAGIVPPTPNIYFTTTTNLTGTCITLSGFRFGL